MRAKKPDGKDHEYRTASGPDAGQPRRTPQSKTFSRAHRLPHQRLCGKGKPIEPEGHYHEELLEHLIGRQRHVAEPGAEEQERDQHRLEQQRPDQDVGIQEQHASPPRAVEQAQRVTPGRVGKDSAA